MCFSTTASFTAGAGLLLVGSISLVKAKTTSQYVLACIPILFAAQQLIEGLLWLALSHAAYARWSELAMYLFLAFAQTVWPIMVPLSMLLFEKDPVRKKILLGLLGTGVLSALYLGYSLLNYHASARIEEHHIRYSLGFPFQSRLLRGIPYMLATAISPFVSSHKLLRMLGWALVLSYVLTAIIYTTYLTSVWCFFGSILSMLILFIIVKMNSENLKAIAIS
ncbi:DUF6629 family protein [Pedobacter gandavensis]|uniref:Uncharacterized protein n=1 Tax=Pedobacter gandavensis TaxID=2679963 RepID=A0ABR6ETA0_9SPHI|nr:DUF6629 family protein [Pedobacter gandavensis]MBB2148049.1 hypothetical protein [Pedobacter gandavensis]